MVTRSVTVVTPDDPTTFATLEIPVSDVGGIIPGSPGQQGENTSTPVRSAGSPQVSSSTPQLDGMDLSSIGASAMDPSASAVTPATPSEFDVKMVVDEGVKEQHEMITALMKAESVYMGLMITDRMKALRTNLCNVATSQMGKIEGTLILVRMEDQLQQISKQKSELDLLQRESSEHRIRYDMTIKGQTTEIESLKEQLAEAKTDRKSEVKYQRDQTDKYRLALDDANVKFHRRFGISLSDWGGDESTLMELILQNVDMVRMTTMYEESILRSPSPNSL